jgi:hypothetical protein
MQTRRGADFAPSSSIRPRFAEARTRASVQIVYGRGSIQIRSTGTMLSSTPCSALGATIIARKDGPACHGCVRELSKDCKFERGCYGITLRRIQVWMNGMSGARRSSRCWSRPLCGKGRGIVGLQAIRSEMKAAYMTAYSEYATSGSQTGSKQDSILQKPFSSSAMADMIRDVRAGKAGEHSSDAKECRVL